MALVLAVAAMALFGVAAVTDAFSRRIPNPVSIALAALGLVRIGSGLVAGETALTAALDLAAALGVFTLAALAFRFRLLGGGDVKLLAAGTLWLGAAALGPYLLVTVLAGGMMAVAFAAWHLVRPVSARGRAPSLPYAVAIAAGGILTTAGLWS
jgi:prepilin peptidase CpaA